MTKTILITGGAGYIGSHTTLELLQAGHAVAVIDNLSNSSAKTLDRVRALAGSSAQLHFLKADVRDANSLDGLFKAHDISGVIHFAAGHVPRQRARLHSRGRLGQRSLGLQRAGLESRTRHRAHVPRRMALAVSKPPRLLNKAILVLLSQR